MRRIHLSCNSAYAQTGVRLRGSRKSQRSEIFGKRSTGSAHTSFAQKGKARVLPTAPTKKCDFCFCEGAFKRAAFTPFQIAESFRQIEGACKKRGFCARDLIIEKGSRKSQRSEIFGKRSTGSAHASFALYGKARTQPTAPTSMRVPKGIVFGTRKKIIRTFRRSCKVLSQGGNII